MNPGSFQLEKQRGTPGEGAPLYQAMRLSADHFEGRDEGCGVDEYISAVLSAGSDGSDEAVLPADADAAGVTNAGRLEDRFAFGLRTFSQGDASHQGAGNEV